jgi:16S rRNA U1498 N3-methylase RsmE
LLENSRLIVFDKHIDQDWSWLLKDDQNWSKIYWLVWPEWWLTDNDYKMFWNNFGIKSLWENILRTETAAIIGGREIKNLGL